MSGQVVALVLLWVVGAAVLAVLLQREITRPKPRALVVRLEVDLLSFVEAMNEMAKELAKLQTAMPAAPFPALAEALADIQHAFDPHRAEERDQ